MSSTKRFPLWLQVVVAVVAGAALGAWVGTQPLVLGFGTQELGRLGMLVIRVLKGLAVPLVFMTVLEAILRHAIRPARFGKLVLVCALNATVALGIGLVLVNWFAPGKPLAPYFAEAVAAHPPASGAAVSQQAGVVAGLEALVPKTILEPVETGSVVGAVLLAVLFGMALRRVRALRGAETGGAPLAVEQIVHEGAAALVVALAWVVEVVPLAAFALVASAVGKAGLGVFADLWIFLVLILAAMLVHALVWYPTVAWLVGRKSPRAYLGGATDAVVAGIATNSSLATVPVTLRCLDRMGVSPESSRLAACVGTNLNNDGITLYEVMAALIIAQACGFELGLGAQVAVAVSAVLAGLGIAGVPEAGLIILPMVLAAAGLPEPVIAVAVPLVVSMDWILARGRTVLNVLSDMVVAVAIDGGATRGARPDDVDGSAGVTPSAGASTPRFGVG